jgi:hypothetical protein
VLTIVVLIAGLFIGAQMGLLAGKRPLRLGVNDGQLQPVRTQLSNAVSSTATTDLNICCGIKTNTKCSSSITTCTTATASEVRTTTATTSND